MNKLIAFCSLLSWFCIPCYSQQMVKGSSVIIQSPDHHISAWFYQREDSKHLRTMYYKINYNDMEVIRESVLAIQMDNHLLEKAMALKEDQHKNWCENLMVDSITYSTCDTTWRPVSGERSQIRDNYNSADIKLVKNDNPMYKMQVQLRVYNEGLALRYYFPENDKGTYYNITAENTEFSLPKGTMAWFANWAQAPYLKLPLNNWPGESERPLTLELPNGLFASLSEARMVDYTRTKFKLSADKPSTLVTAMFDRVQLISPVASPWRVVMIAEKPADLITNNFIMLNLNEASKIADCSWIKPGKIMRVMSQTTADAKANIDFALKHNLQYILFDWKWYGPAFSFNSDAAKVAIPDFDLPAIIKYGNEKGVGTWLYVNQQGLYAQSDSLFSVYQKWGVKGVKFGFVQVGSQRWTTWLEKTIAQAAASHIMVNIHDEWRSTGEERTWPNLMTAEGVRGNEEMPDATHNTILPFTRYVAGPADYTICYFDERIKTTHAHQLALAAIYYSPLQTLYWYDAPLREHNEPELKFWDDIPTTWDETLVLQGQPGQYISTARRKGSAWFIGTITNNKSRQLKLDLKFLNPAKKYRAQIYSDDPTVATSTHVRVSNSIVSNNTVLNINLLPSGGQAMCIEEIK